jgi:NAD(P)-dependent dehydrogenase (short-subunit alcohol dehydrogenase family)
MCVPYEETVDGFEMQIAVRELTAQSLSFGFLTMCIQVNYIGHFLFTKLLLPVIQQAAESSDIGAVRIVNVSSDGHAKLAPKEGILFSDINMKDNFSVWARYGHSKLANVLHSRELAKRYPDILSVSVHPGTVKTYA